MVAVFFQAFTILVPVTFLVWPSVAVCFFFIPARIVSMENGSFDELPHVLSSGLRRPR